ncbi:MAG: LL-diaminopimelate aminotransferase [Chloroflexi bacterium]|nr:LL-diaminopimelate aminotransferase [Chloroflexota bacterium]
MTTPAVRIQNLPPYLFAEVDRRIAEKRAAGFDVISLGIGDPDLPSPDFVVEAAQEAVADPRYHRYPDYYGRAEFRQAIARWYGRRFGVELDPNQEIVPLIGSKEGIAHMAVAYVDPGDVVLVPDPGYPVYSIGTLLANGVPFTMPLKAENGFLPDLDAIPVDIAHRAKLIWVNYPNNPTAATADLAFFERVVEFGRRHNILVCHDNAYSDVAYDGYRPPSLLQIPGAKDAAVEFHSLSKTYNMTGWRVGMMVGNQQAVEALGRVKTNVDSGIFDAVQMAGIAALDGPDSWVEERNARFQQRRDLIVGTLNRVGLSVAQPRASLYIWAPVPDGYNSVDFSLKVLDDAAVWLTPGVGFGAHGEGYFRISLTVADHRLIEALERLERLSF